MTGVEKKQKTKLETGLKTKRSIFTVLWIILCVLGAAFKIIWDILWRFPKMDIAARQAYLQKRASGLLQTMGISLEQQGVALLTRSCLRAANHVSWLDIVVLYACGPCRFIAKAEVERLPLIGRIARNAGTLFINRSSIKDAIRISNTVAKALKKGDCVAFFPEGTTSPGDGLLPLHASLFESAVQAQSCVQTAVLRFHTSKDTRACHDASYVGNTTLVGTLWRTLRHGDIRALVVGLEPMHIAASAKRRVVCARVQDEMETTLNHLNYNRQALLAARAGQCDDKTMNQIDEELQRIFFSDARQWIASGMAQVHQLQKTIDNYEGSRAALMNVRQAFHYLKGGSRMVGFAEFGRSAMVCEECLDSWITGKKTIPASVALFALQSLEDLNKWLKDLELGHVSLLHAAMFEKAAQDAKAI